MLRRAEIKKTGFWVSCTFIGTLIAVLILVAIASHMGWRFNFVSSGSMEPVLKTGSLVVSRPVEPGSIGTGDIITFHDNSPEPVSITHRVTGVWDNSPIYFQTRGDACQTKDPFIVPAKNVTGKVSFSIPYAGYFFHFLQTPAGSLVCITIPFIMLLLMYFHGIAGEIRHFAGYMGKRFHIRRSQLPSITR